MTLNYKITENDENKTLKTILQSQFHLSNRLITKLKTHQKIFVNQQIAFINEIPPFGALIEVCFDIEEEDAIVPQKGNLDILYEDDYFLAVNKPANLVVHPCSYHPDGTLANFVKEYLKNHKKIRPINRIDRDTSGIVLFAKNEYIQEIFKNLPDRPQKEYIAIVWGTFSKKQGMISLPIARKPDSLIEREVNFEMGQEAVTYYEVMAEASDKAGNSLSLVKIYLKTGRTHQIRVHMSYLGHPILGDSLYGDKETDFLETKEQIKGKLARYQEKIDIEINRQALHAYRLCFQHPITQKRIQIMAPLPKDIEQIYETFFANSLT